MDASKVGARSLARMDAKLFVEEYVDVVVAEAGDELLLFFLCNGDKGDRGGWGRLARISWRRSWIDCSKNCLVSELFCLICVEICCISDLCKSFWFLKVFSVCCWRF